MKKLIAFLLLAGIAFAADKPAAKAAAAPASTAGQYRLPDFKRVQLPNGLTLLLMERREIPLVSMNITVKSGATADASGKEGTSSLTAGLLRKGTQSKSAQQIAEQMDSIGMTFGARAVVERTIVDAEFLRKDTDTGLNLVSDLLLHPSFPQEEFAKLSTQQRDLIRSAKDDPNRVLMTYYYSYLYGNHPYARPVNGDERSLQSVSRDDVLSFYKANYAPANTIISVAGDFSAPEMEKQLRDRFGSWTGRSAALPVPKAATPVNGKRLLLVDKPDASQTYFAIGNLGIARTNPDRPLINAVNTLFGGRFTSMLNSELRIKSGLSYGASSGFSQFREPGAFTMQTFTKNATTEQAIDKSLEVLDRLHKNGLTDEELASAKAYIRGLTPPQVETSDQLAAQMAELEFYNLPRSDFDSYLPKIDAMTTADARRIIDKYFPTDQLVFVLIGKGDEIGKLAQKYASKIENKKISDPGF